MDNDTIAAIATGMRPAGISIIRISGDKAFEIADKVFRARSGRSVEKMKSFTVSYGNIVRQSKAHGNDTDSTVSEILDEVLLIKMAAPKTYTRENIVEIDCHGGIAVTKAVLDLILSNGARLAEPGEFTKRAFLNGRIDLSQAEAVSDLIASGSEAAVRNSVKQLGGEIRDRISALRNELLTKTAYIEAALDDPEHIELEGFSETLSKTVGEAETAIEKLIVSFESGRIIKNGINTVILGLPNVGKSSLMNRILGTERAIVTDIAGTTRDTLSESAVFNGIMLNIIDTAGIRNTDDVIEKIGVEKAREAAENADLLLFVTDAGQTLVREEETEILKTLTDKNAIILINKTDISNDSDISGFIGDIREKCGITGNNENMIPIVEISAKTGKGIEELGDCISEMFFKGRINADDEIYITNVRQKELLVSARKSLDNVRSAIDQGLSEDFYTIDLMDAIASLGKITGENVEDELANKIFSEFCMGK